MLIALTGGIGSGKSTVASEWVRLGAIEIDADQLAREVVEPGQPGLAALVAEFGEQVLDATGQLNRAKLAEISFSDPGTRKKVESLLHPLIQELAAQRTKLNSQGVIVYTIPLLVETQSPLRFDKVVTISCPESIRIERLLARGMSREDAIRRIASQATDAEREARSDVVIDSNCTLSELLSRARDVYKALTHG
ncbi:MAG: dephospho-CoA kinase [Aquiluna sp.]